MAFAYDFAPQPYRIKDLNHKSVTLVCKFAGLKWSHCNYW